MKDDTPSAQSTKSAAHAAGAIMLYEESILIVGERRRQAAEIAREAARQRLERLVSFFFLGVTVGAALAAPLIF